MNYKACLIGLSISILSVFTAMLTIPANSTPTVQLLPPNLDGPPSGFPDEMSAMPCCNVQESVKPDIPHYTINGMHIDESLQDYIYNVCVENGVEWYYMHFLDQIYQESHFNPKAISENGLDYGYCQLRITYHEDFKELVGHPEWDLVNDQYANLYTGCFLMSMYLAETDDDIPSALMKYYNSGSEYWNQKYVNDVLQWVDKTERIN